MTETAPAAEAAPKSALGETLEVVRTVVYALLIALVLRVLLFQPFTIPSASMEPSLYEGDYIIVTKFSYGYSHHSIPLSPPLFAGRLFGREPARGDIAVFKTPADNRTDLIKRVIGLPGDRIQMKNDRLYINDRIVPREPAGFGPASCPFGPAANVPRFRETLPGGRSIVVDDCMTDGPLDNTDVFVVPEAHYFMMGDNRDNSADSRVPAEAGGVGYMPDENLVGHAQVILLAWNPGAALFKPWTWLNLNIHRFLHPLK